MGVIRSASRIAETPNGVWWGLSPTTEEADIERENMENVKIKTPESRGHFFNGEWYTDGCIMVRSKYIKFSNRKYEGYRKNKIKFSKSSWARNEKSGVGDDAWMPQYELITNQYNDDTKGKYKDIELTDWYIKINNILYMAVGNAHFISLVDVKYATLLELDDIVHLRQLKNKTGIFALDNDGQTIAVVMPSKIDNQGISCDAFVASLKKLIK